ncbi:MAG: ribulose-phosphate 3-epimerase [Hyphomicrobiales bacterium]
MPKPASNWIETLPSTHTIAEFSMWSANLANLAAELTRIQDHADILHVDVADGVFAPAFLFFPDLVSAMRNLTDKPIHVHLMVDDGVLLSQIEQFIEAGSDLISFHLENKALAGKAFDLLDAARVAAGMVLRVETPVSGIAEYVDRLRFVTLLGTAIGVKGQGLDANAFNRLQEARMIIEKANLNLRIVLAADGGIREHTVPQLVSAGAETVVMGSLAFGASDLSERMTWLRKLAQT